MPRVRAHIRRGRPVRSHYRRWAYHATSLAALSAIRKEGLSPRQQPPEHSDEQRGTADEVVFFGHAPDTAALWGEETLRFPWPEDAEQDPYGDALRLPSGEIAYTNWFTRSRVPPEQIRIRRDGKWVKL